MERLTELGRRVLGHLPVFHPDEDWLIEQEGGPEVSVRSYTLGQLTERLAEDASTHVDGVPSLSPTVVQDALNLLAGEGFCVVDEAGNWRMTQLGLEAIVHVHDDQPEAPAGAVTVPLHPATVESGAA